MMKLYFFPLMILMMMLMIMFMFMTNFILHPISIVIMLIMYSILICLNMSIWKNNYIYSIIMFLIMISGLLIIFLYFSSLISNEQINLFLNKILLLTFLMNFLFFYQHNNGSIFKNFYNHKFNEIMQMNYINDKSFHTISLIYEYPFNYMTISCMFYLLITLFTIIKICTMKNFSLRKIK